MRRLLFLALVIVVVSAVGVVWLSYSRVTVENPRIADVDVAFTDSAGDVLRGGLALLSGDVIEAIDLVVDGMEITLAADVHNPGPAPVYIPELTHKIYLNDVAVGTAETTLDGLIGAGGAVSATSEVVIGAGDLGASIVEGVTRGGELDLEVETTYKVLFFSGEVRSEVFRFNLLEEVSGFLR